MADFFLYFYENSFRQTSPCIFTFSHSKCYWPEEGHDYDQNGIPDVAFTGSDTDNDSLNDVYEGNTTDDKDVNDEMDYPYTDLPNTDGDAESDYRDTDDDEDGIDTTDEDLNGDGNYANDDTNGNGIPEYLELNLANDEMEVFNVITPNGDGIHDVLSINGLEDYPNNSIGIYNRWGIQVYATKAYNTQGNVSLVCQKEE